MAYKKTLLILASLILVLGICIWWVWPDDRVHVVVCDVGQGDAILVSRGFVQLLVDGGPDDRVLGCLSDHIPFFDRTIEMMVMTHPQSDHFAGLIHVLDRYRVSRFFAGPEKNNTVAYLALRQVLQQQHLEPVNLFTGQRIQFAGVKYEIVWPSREWVEGHMKEGMSDGTDLNGFGVVGRIQYGSFDMLLTADADIPVEPMQMQTGKLVPVEVLKVPHHGSRTGMLPDWLDILQPKVAIISSGKGNRYGHPAPEALELLQQRGMHIYRTDKSGDVEVIADGQEWRIRVGRGGE